VNELTDQSNVGLLKPWEKQVNKLVRSFAVRSFEVNKLVRSFDEKIMLLFWADKTPDHEKSLQKRCMLTEKKINKK